MARVATPAAGGGITTLFKDSAFYGAGRMLQKFLWMLMVPLYTSYLTPTDYGVMGMVIVTQGLIDVIVTAGWDSTFSRFYFDDRSETHRGKVITQTFYVDTVYPTVLLGLLLLAMPWISSIIMNGSGYTLYFDIAIITIFFTNLSDLPFTLFRLDHKPKTFLAFTSARALIQIPLTVLFVAVFHWGVYGILLGNLVPAVVLNIAALPSYVHRLRFTWEPELLKRMARFAIPNVPAMLAFYLLNFSDRYLINRFSTLDQVGLYTAAYTLAQPVYFAGFAFRLAWPQWHYRWLKQPAVHKRQVARGYTYYMVLTCAVVTLLGVFMPLMIRLLLHNPDFWSVGTTAFVLVLSYACFNTYHLFMVGVNVTKNNRYLPVPVVIAAVVNITLNVLLIPRYGMIAAAWSTLIGFALLAVLVRQLSDHYYPIKHEWGRVSKLVLAATVTLLAAWGLARATGQSVDMPFWELVAHQLLAVPLLLLFPLTLWATRFFSDEEKPALRRLWLRVTGRGAKEERAIAAGAGAAGGVGNVGDDLAGITFDEDELAEEEDREDRAWNADARDDPGVLP